MFASLVSLPPPPASPGFFQPFSYFSSVGFFWVQPPRLCAGARGRAFAVPASLAKEHAQGSPLAGTDPSGLPARAGSSTGTRSVFQGSCKSGAVSHQLSRAELGWEAAACGDLTLLLPWGEEEG